MIIYIDGYLEYQILIALDEIFMEGSLSLYRLPADILYVRWSSCRRATPYAGSTLPVK